MLRTLKLIVMLLLAAALILFAVLNMALVEVRLLPAGLVHTVFPSTIEHDYAIRLPIAAVILLSVFAGLVLGSIFEWLREHRYRKTARVKRREANDLERENIALKRKLEDDDLPRIAVR